MSKLGTKCYKNIKIIKIMKVLLEFRQEFKSDLQVMSRGSGLLQKFKVMLEGPGRPKKMKSRGYPGGDMVQNNLNDT